MRDDRPFEATDGKASDSRFRGVGALTIVAHGGVRLVRSWRLVLGFPLAAAVLAAGVSLLLPAQYESDITIVPQSQGSSAVGPLGGALGGGGIAAIAEGLVGGAFGGNSGLDYFAALIVSRRVADQVLTSPLPRAVDPRVPSARDLLDVYRINSGTLEENLERGHRVFGRTFSVEGDPASGLMKISVRARTPDLALVIGRLILKALNDANLAVRDQAAQAQVAFIRTQTEHARVSLETAEDSLRTFYEGNRTYQTSPSLKFQEGRLHRRVDLAQSVYVSVSQQLEQARYTAAQDVPVFSVIDAPNAPALKSFPKRARMVLLSGLLAWLFVVTLVLFQAYFRTPDPDDSLTATRQLEGALRVTRSEMITSYRKFVGRR